MTGSANVYGKAQVDALLATKSDASKVTIATTAPSSPAVGQAWVDTSVPAPTSALLANAAARAYRSAAMALPTSGSFTTITWDTHDAPFDDVGLHSLTTSPTRFTAPVAGRYRLTGQVEYAPNVTGVRIVRVLKNGARLCDNAQNALSDGTTANRVQVDSGIVQLAAGDYLEVAAFQSSGGSLSLNTGATSTWAVFTLDNASIAKTAARVWRSTTQTLTTAVAAAVSFDTDEFNDGSAFHSTASNTSRLTAPATGRYRITAEIDFSPSATGIRQLQLVKNGATVLGSATANGLSDGVTSTKVEVHSGMIALTSGDYVEVQALQTSGGNLTVASGQAVTWASIERIS